MRIAHGLYGFTRINILTVLCASFLFFSCPNDIKHPQQEYGYFVLYGDNARTITTIKPDNIVEDNVPSASKFVLEFYVGTNPEITKTITWAEREDVFVLSVGTYDLTATLYNDANEPYLQGTLKDIEIEAGKTCEPNAPINLLPITNTGTGIFEWKITVPADLASAQMTIEYNAGTPVIGITNPINLITTYPYETQNTFTLPSGGYIVKITLTNLSGTYNYPPMALHIYQNMTSKYAETLPAPVFENSPENPFEIWTETDLRNVGKGIDGWTMYASYKLMADISLTDPTLLTPQIGDGTRNWTPIGDATSSTFYGNFYGNNRKISNMIINTSKLNSNFCGMFNSIGDGATIKELTLEINFTHGIYSSGGYTRGDFVGAIAGQNDGTIINCSISGTLEGDSIEDIGGIVGRNFGIIKNCVSELEIETTGITSSGIYLEMTNSSRGVGGITGYNGSTGSISNSTYSGTLNGTRNTGGIVGINYQGEIDNCENYGNIIGTGTEAGNRIGGIAGANFSGTIKNSYSKGSINGIEFIGGIVGFNSIIEGKTGSVIENCYNEGDVTGTNYLVGGIVGSNNNGIIKKTYSTGDINGKNYVGGITGYNLNKGEVLNCYSSGDINGEEYVGGIVGWNFQDSIIEKCYAIGKVTGKGNIGGIAGANNEATSQGTIKNCVALNPSINISSGNLSSFGRIVGQYINDNLNNNYAKSDMSFPNITMVKGHDKVDGADVNTSTPNGGYNSQSFWENTMTWDFSTIWKWDTTSNLPVLQ